jgi:hypothetical protein
MASRIPSILHRQILFWRTRLIEEGENMLPLDFDFDLEEIVQMAGVGPVSLKSALQRMRDRIGVRSALYRDSARNRLF